MRGAVVSGLVVGALGGLGWCLAPSPSGADIDPDREARQRWARSYVPHGSPRTVRIAVVVRGGDRIKRAAVHETRRAVQITLVRTNSDLPGTAEGELFCVAVRLRRASGDRRRVDGATGRAPDRAKRGTADARLRDDTRSLDLSGRGCRRLRVNHY